MQLRHDTQFDAMRQLAAQKSAGMLQALLCFSMLAIQTREENLCVRIIARHFHASNGYQTHTRIIDFKTHQLGQFTLNLLRDTFDSGKVWHYNARASSKISYTSSLSPTTRSL